MTSTLPAIGALLALTAASVFLGPQSQSLARKDIPGVVNYSRVDATVGCAGATEVAALPALKSEGFVSIVNLRRADEPGVDIHQASTAARDLELKYFHVPLSSSKPEPDAVDRFLEVVSNPDHQPVFIHCGSANRVGAVWLVKRVLLDKWAIERAVEEAEAIGLRSPDLRAFAMDYIRTKGEPSPRP